MAEMLGRQARLTSSESVSAIDPSYRPKVLKRSGLSIESSDFDLSNQAKILVLYCGGTIGMKSHGGVYIPEPNFLVPELRKLPMFHDPEFTLSPDYMEHPLIMPESSEGKRVIYCIYEYEPLLDSCNMTIDDYARLATDIVDNYGNFDGFVILHGTDTMAYTASALSFMLENLGKPVIVTGSQIPIFETRSDGRDNLLGALIMAGHYCIPEVMIYFHHKLIRGNRSMKVDSGAFDAFHSPNLPPLAELEIKIKVNWDSILRPKAKKFTAHLNMCPNVGLLRLFPSITAQTVQAFLQPPMEGVVIQSYGAGNGPDAREDLISLFRDASKRGILILNITQCQRGVVTTSYATGKALLDAGVIPGSDMTPESALMKLAYILGKDEWDHAKRKKKLQQNLRGEMKVALQRGSMHMGELSLVGKLADAMKLSSVEERELLKNTILPSLCCAAAQQANVDELKMLSNSGAIFTMADYDGRTALHVAASAGHLDVVSYLLNEGFSVHVRDRYGHSALDDAVRFNHHEIIKLLVKAGAHLNMPPAKMGMMLCNTAMFEETKGMESWRLADANLSQGDYTNRTALHVAAEQGNKDMVRYLIKHNVDKEVKDKLGRTPLEEASINGVEEIVMLLSKVSTQI